MPVTGELLTMVWIRPDRRDVKQTGVSPKEIKMKMKKALSNACWTAILVTGMALSVSVYAEKPGGMMGMGSQPMSGVMHDMSKEMGTMSGQMSQGNMSPEMQKQMAERMKQMSGMLENMSGMTGKGMMMDADMQKQMDRMRKQMDEMMKGSPMTPQKKY